MFDTHSPKGMALCAQGPNVIDRAREFFQSWESGFAARRYVVSTKVERDPPAVVGPSQGRDRASKCIDGVAAG